MLHCVTLAKIEYFSFFWLIGSKVKRNIVPLYGACAKMRRPCYCVIIIIIKEEKEFVIRVSNLKN